MSKPRNNISIERLRERLEDKEGPAYWRSLEELADSDEMRDMLAREFPEQASEWNDPKGRRRFLKIMGASLALAGLAGCTRQPLEKMLPYVKRPEEIEPKKPLFFATAFPSISGFAEGVVAESYMGRPIKIEGNPRHPASLGATDTYAQASVLSLYDPDRSEAVRRQGRISSWGRFQEELAPVLAAARLNEGAGVRILTETVTSPTLGEQIASFIGAYPQARWHQYEPLAPRNSRPALRATLGSNAAPVYRFDLAEIVLSLGSNFLHTSPGSVRYARDFIQARTPEGEMNRLYVVENTPTVTGGMADHRLPVRASQIGGIARAVAEELGIPVPYDLPPVPEIDPVWVEALVTDLQQNPGESLVVAGDDQPIAVHALVYAINDALGNTGQTVLYPEPPEYRAVMQNESLRQLVADMRNGEVDLLFILGANPVYYAPADLEFAEALTQVALPVHLGQYVDETARLCQWHIPQTHYLEAWSDLRAFEGTLSVQQPVIDRLYESCRSVHEFMAFLTGDEAETSYTIIQEHWEGRYQGDDFPTFWDEIVHAGLVPPDAPIELDPLPPLLEAMPEFEAPEALFGEPVAEPEQAEETLEIFFQPDPSLIDGRYANSGWLQELPKPITKLTWDNAALISPATAEELGVTNEDVVRLEYKGREVVAPVWVLPGQADGSVTVRLGYGRVSAGRVGNGVGFNAYELRTSEAPWFDQGLTVVPTGEEYPLASTQLHYAMHGRDLARVGTHEQYERNPNFAVHPEEVPEEHETLYPLWNYEEGYQWGMSIDLNSCIGCGSCTIACQAENNIPVVGKDQVLIGREMHWIRVDRYFKGSIDNPDMIPQPVPCMHCETAPCEVVCPVNATVHNDQGLNMMVYNRCIGTRYCSNNCPYKVRRFNFLEYAGLRFDNEKKLRNNPEVTVRSRGVMEKCTYCVQRIHQARQEAQKEERRVLDGEIQTACQQVCPTNAIVFGNINDPDSRVSREKASPRNYALLAELNTRPRTTYLARINNPHDALYVPEEQEEEIEERAEVGLPFWNLEEEE